MTARGARLEKGPADAKPSFEEAAQQPSIFE